MKGILAGGMYSIMIFVWLLISLVVFILCYKRLAKQMLIVVGSALGSILLTMGIMGFFSGLANVMRTIGETASLSIAAALEEGIRYARIPFQFATVATILFFIIIAILIAVRKQPFKRWSVWAGFAIFLLLSFAPAVYRQMMNTRLLQGISRIMGHGDTIPTQVVPIIWAGRTVVITTFALLMVYLLVAIFATIFKREKKTEADKAEKPPVKEEQPPEKAAESTIEKEGGSKEQAE
jgi:cbb3-type cytochrome oxidase subunit 3